MDQLIRFIIYFVLSILVLGGLDQVAHLPDYNTYLWGVFGGIIISSLAQLFTPWK